jgi:6-phosphogluconolactonase
MPPATAYSSAVMRLRVFSDADNLADAAADEVAGWARLDRVHPTVGLAGGTTPRLAYERLRRLHMPWDRAHAWLTDERAVPSAHPDSNSGMIARTLFDHVPATFHPVAWTGDAAAAAGAYEAELARFLPQGPGGLQPGLVVLGVGIDGHTASLFPGTAALDETRRGFVANWVPQLSAWRLTATLPLLIAARRTVFLVSGQQKAEIVAEVLEGDTDLPAAVISRESRDAVWLLDREAASLLGGT